MLRFPVLFRLLLLGLLAASVARAGLPVSADYTDTLYGVGAPLPTSMAFAPDGSGRLFVSLKYGEIGVIPPGGGRLQPFSYIRPVYTLSEGGALGLCFDPDYIRNRWVYVFVTISAREQRIYRYRDGAGTGVEKTALQMVLPTLGRNHNGGALGVGPDARLYWAVGDNGLGMGANADVRSLAAKIGRANLDGTLPADNPLSDGAAGPINDYIWATGFRNPFTLAFQPRTGLLWLNVVGSAAATNGYEQIFTPAAGEDGGWNQYEGNQPAGARYSQPRVRPFAHPIMQYKTAVGDSAAEIREIASIARAAGTLRVVLTRAHPYRVGQLVTIVRSGALDGEYIVGALEGTAGFTAPSEGADTVGAPNQGQVRLPPAERCVAGGCFYESTAFPTSARGSYLFPDFSSGNIRQLRLDEANRPAGISRLIQRAGSVTGMAVGPDGAVYYAEFASGTIRRVAYRQPAGLVVTPTTLRVLEGGDAAFNVQLPAAPAAAVTVSVTPPAPSGVTISSGATLTFTPANWRTPQVVRLTAPLEPGTVDQSADLTVSAPGYADETVRALVTDTTANAPEVSVSAVEVTGGGSAEFTVHLPSQPPASTIITTRYTRGSAMAPVTQGGALIFTPENWQTPQTVRLSARAFHGPDGTATYDVTGRGYFRRVITATIHPAP